jgi:poly(A) polymerase
MIAMPLELAPEQKAKLLTPAVQRLLAALKGQARIVGGAVRDVLLDRQGFDIDFATPLPPDEATQLLTQAGLKSVPTGLAHGTITAVVDGIGYEITTLRRDVETDGRHAKVAFTDDWQEDAKRRDFTMNALYVDANGTLYDYFNGAEDAQQGIVKFIGDARARIKEDILRILRFFRFYAFFGQGDPDRDAIVACRELAPLVPTLSAERIAKEVLKLLKAENPLPALRLMVDSRVMKFFLPEACPLDRLEKLLATENKYRAEPSPIVRLAALLPEDEKIALAVAKRLKLSNKDIQSLGTLAKLPARLRADMSGTSLHRVIYEHGADATRAATLLVGGNISDALTTSATWTVPAFPVRGEDLLKTGIPAGPKVGAILRLLETWWISTDFTADRASCLAHLKTLL